MNLDKYLIEDQEAYDYKCDPTILFDTSLLHYLPTFKPIEKPEVVFPHECYPCTNSYYQFAEDYDAVSRVPHFLHDNKLISDCTHKKHEKDHDPFLAYLRSKPVCFLILGKPGIGEISFSKALAEYWQCIYIDPLNLIQEEIESASQAGLCIDFNLRNGKSIGIDIILRLLQKKLKDESVKHRGFILCGFPLVPNDIFSENKIFSESAIFNAQDIFEDIFDASLGYEERKNVSRSSREESKEDLSTNICFQSSYFAESKDQVDFIFQLIKDFYYLIIYMRCENSEVVNIHENNYIDSQSYDFVNLSLDKPDLYINVETSISSSTKKLLKLQSDYPTYVRSQLVRYQYEFEAAIEKYILLQNPEHVIRIDARMSPHKLFQIVKMRLRLLPLTKAIIPKSLLGQNLQEELGEGLLDSPQLYNFEENTPEEWYDILRNVKTPGPLYKWHLSNWGFKCPVAMFDGKQVIGNPKLAVNFFRYIFFLSSEEALQRFIKNPRPFLLPPFPKSLCRVYILGPIFCGKSAIAKTISYTLGGSIIYSEEIIRNYTLRKKKQLLEKARSIAETQGIELLKQQRKDAYLLAENERLVKVQEFCNQLKVELKQYIDCYQLISNFEEIEVTSFPSPRFREKSTELIHCVERINELNLKFKDINLPIDDVYLYEELIKDNSDIEQYIPEYLKEPLQFDFDVISVEHSFVKSYTKSIMSTIRDSYLSSHLDADNLADSYKCAIEEADQQIDEVGWIIDSLPMNIELVEKLFSEVIADIIILLNDSSPNFRHLKKVYEEAIPIDIQDYKDFFIKIGDLQTAEKIESYSKDSDTSISFVSFKPIEEDQNTEYLNKFQENYEKIIKYLQTNNIPYLESSLNDKSIEDVCAELIDEIRGKHVVHAARQLGPEDELQDLIDLGAHPDDEELGEFGEDQDTKEMVEENRKLGDLNLYCPVSYFDYGVLWKGKKSYSARYKNKTNYFCSEEALGRFLNYPWNYEFEKKPVQIPPLRICVRGVKQSGKTTLSKALARNLGLIYVNFENKLLENLAVLEIDDLENYSASAAEVSDDVLRKILFPLWFEKPGRLVGIVIDGFPQSSDQIKFLCSNFLIPEIILNLECSQELSNKRFLDIMLAEWKLGMDKEILVDKTNYDNELNIWKTNRAKRKRELIEERRDMRYNQKGDEDEIRSVNSIEEDEDLKEIEDILIHEFREPVLIENLETFEEAKIRLQSAIESDDDNPDYIGIKDRCDEELINWVNLDANKGVDNTLIQALIKLVPLKYKNISFFERLYDVSVDFAERLLDEGYYYISRFGKTCPVQLYENHNLMQMFLALDRQFQVFPVLHQRYIYFLGGLEARKKFKENVLKYINQVNSMLPLPLIRLAIIGPPKSGKTTICKRFEYEYGLKHVSIGASIRYVLKNLSKSVLAKNVDDCLRNGQNLPDDLVIKCVEAFSFENIATGVVMDGFPKSKNEIKELAKLNLLPYLILELHQDYKATKNSVFELGDKLIYNRFLEWTQSITCFKNWVHQEYQNLTRVLTSPSQWSTWSLANNHFLDTLYAIKYYYMNINHGFAVRITHMLVTPYEFFSRQSSFKSYCPCCLFYDNKLRTGGIPPDRSGLVQHKYNFYWLCPDHINNFIENADSYLVPNIRHSLPTILPHRISFEEIPENVFDQGDCAVCLKEKRRIKGELGIAANFHDQVYLFDKEECLQAFLSFPHNYSIVSSELGIDHLPEIKLNDLPVLGYLEQFDNNQVIKALINTNTLRPLIPGLDLEASALICMGLFLKIKNPLTSERNRCLYEDSRECLLKSRNDLIDCLGRMKKTINPYINYTERETKKKLLTKMKSSRSSAAELVRINVREMLNNIVDELPE